MVWSYEQNINPSHETVQGYACADVQAINSKTRMHMVDFRGANFIQTNGNTWGDRFRYL